MHMLSSSGNAQIDTITADVIASFEAQFPNRISGYYFQGSCADQATTALSDIDLHVMFRLPPTDAQQRAVAALRTTLQQRSSRPLDLSYSDEPTLHNADRLRFQPEWAPVFHAVTLKRVVHASGFIATALVALHTTLVIADKRTAVTAYRQLINDQWAEHLEAVHTYCRVRWDYHVPTAATDQAILRKLCERELAFENHFLVGYKAFLQQEQTVDDIVARQFAAERLRGIRCEV